MEDECFPKDTNIMKEHHLQVLKLFSFRWFIFHSISYVCLLKTYFCNSSKALWKNNIRQFSNRETHERIVYQLNCNAKGVIFCCDDYRIILFFGVCECVGKGASL